MAIGAGEFAEKFLNRNQMNTLSNHLAVYRHIVLSVHRVHILNKLFRITIGLGFTEVAGLSNRTGGEICPIVMLEKTTPFVQGLGESTAIIKKYREVLKLHGEAVFPV